MKKITYIICVIIILIICCSCGSSNSENTQKVDVETEDESLKKPDEERMLADLKEKHCNTIAFTEWEETITIPIEKMILDKAKDDDDNYIAYCTLYMKNNYYEATVSYCLKYSYYDIGGWQLDECCEESRKIVSVSPDDDILQAYIKDVCAKDDLYEPTIMNLLTYDEVSDENQYAWSCTYDVTAERKYADIYYSYNITCYFNETTGWNFDILNVSFIADDWSKLEGKKFYTGINDGWYFYFEVVSLDSVSKKATVRVIAHYDNGWRYNTGIEPIYDADYTTESSLKTTHYFNDKDLVGYFYKVDKGYGYTLGAYEGKFEYKLRNDYELFASIEFDVDCGISHYASWSVSDNGPFEVVN